MSEIEVKIITSATGWAGIKTGDFLQVTEVEANDRGVFARLEDAFLGKPARPEEIPF